jgi:hypothetical protein
VVSSRLLMNPTSSWYLPKCCRRQLIPISGYRASDVFLFFIFFAFTMLLVLLGTYALRLYCTGYVPKIFLVAVAHSMPVRLIMRRYCARRYSAPLVTFFGMYTILPYPLLPLLSSPCDRAAQGSKP